MAICRPLIATVSHIAAVLQTLATQPETPPPPPEDVDAKLFEEHVKKHSYSSLWKIDCPGDFIPLSQSLADNILNLSCQVEGDFYKAVLQEPGATREDFASEFFLSWSEFKKKKDPKKVVEFLSKCIPELKKQNKTTWAAYLESFLTLIQTGRVDLFEKPSSAFLKPDYVLSPRLKYRIAMYSFNSLMTTSHRLKVALQDKLDTVKRQILQKQVRQSKNALDTAFIMLQFDNMQTFEVLLAQLKKINEKLLKGNTKLSQEQKIDISIVFQRLSDQFLYAFKAFSFSFDPIDGDFTQLYRSIIASDEAKKIAMILSKGGEIKIADLDVFDEGYVEKNRAIFQALIPRIREWQEVFAETHAEMMPLFQLIKAFPLYLHLGDLEKLNARLSVKTDEFAKVLREEILEFGQRRYVPTHLLSEEENGLVLNSSINFRLLEKLLGDFHVLFPTFLEGPMQTASTLEQDLFVPFEQSEVKERVLPVLNPGTQEVQKTAMGHLRDLLCKVKNFSEESQSATGRHHIHAFVVGCIRHATSSAEHMLTAMYRMTNGIVDKKPMAPIFNNNPYLIYEFCRHKTLLPPQLIESIRQANRGELLSRSLSECRLNSSSKVEVLLAKMRLFLQGNDALPPEQLLSQTFSMCDEMVDVCQAAYQQVKTLSSEDAAVFRQLKSSLKNPPAVTCHTAPCQVDNPSLLTLRKSLVDLCNHCVYEEAKRPLNNILNHLLVLLETEMQLTKPHYLHVHCKTVLLQCHAISNEVQDYLKLLSDIEHKDLMPILSKKFSQQEIEFLQREITLRQLLNIDPDYTGLRQKGDAPFIRILRDASEYAQKWPFTSAEDERAAPAVKSLLQEELATLSSFVTKATQFVLARHP